MMNKIKYIRIDGHRCEVKTVGINTYTYIPEKVFSTTTIEWPTDENLLVGDLVDTKDGKSIVKQRIFHPEENYFEFVCQTIYTGRTE